MEDTTKIGIPKEEYEMLCECYGSIVIDNVIEEELERRENENV